MTALRKTIFISDLHLDESHPAISDKFIALINSLDTHTDAVYILGDLFEVWIGDDENTPLQQRIEQALKALVQRGVAVYFLHGNRDFLIGERFLRESGCQLLPDESLIQVYKSSILIMHGDTLCTDDTAYIRARKIMRNRWLQKLFLMLPLFMRKKAAAALRAESRKHTGSVPGEIMDVTDNAVTRIFTKYKVSCLVHGHTHRPRIHHIEVDHNQVSRIVLGAWHDHGNMLVWDENGSTQLIDF